MLETAKPRVRVQPRAVASDVDDAVWLASSYGLTADDWQEDVLEGWLGRRRDKRWAAPKCGLAVPRQNGKNAVLEIRELFGMVALGEKFLHTAHQVKTARKAFLRIASFFENERLYPELAAMVVEIRKTNGQEAVVLNNGGSVEFIARSRNSGRGFTVDVLVLDEAQDLTDEELEALMPTISASPTGNPQTILTGTPPDPEKGETGEVFKRIRSEGEGKTDPRLCWIDYGIEDGPLPDLDDRTLWLKVNPALGTRLQVDVVSDERKLMSPHGFARERLGWWGDPKADAAGPLDLTKWGEKADPNAKAPKRTTLVIDVSPDRRSASIAVVGPIKGGRTLGMVKHGAGMTWVPAEVGKLKAKRDIVEVALNPSSQAGALIPDLEARGIEIYRMTAQETGAACAAFITTVNGDERDFVHLGQPEVAAAIANATTRQSGEVEIWDRRDWSGPDISPVVALASARHRWATHETNEYDVLDSVL